MVVKFWELSWTPGVDQETELGPDKGKGKGLESWKCDSCEWHRTKCVRLKVS